MSENGRTVSVCSGDYLLNSQSSTARSKPSDKLFTRYPPACAEDPPASRSSLRGGAEQHILWIDAS
jgi:hypothetical protein